jgi:membrane-bound inhibitor of C-type lysozyme
MVRALFFFWPIKLLCSSQKAKSFSIALGLFGLTGTISATDLIIHLPATPSLSRQNVSYHCDASGPKIGVPAGPFSVEYINGGGNSLVVVPLGDNALIFSNVVAGSGARYTAQQYTWWEAGGTVTLTSNSLAGKMQSTCRRVEHK